MIFRFFFLYYIAFAADIITKNLVITPPDVSSSASYEITIAVATTTPANSKIVYTFPSQVTITDAAPYTCNFPLNFKTGAVCSASGNVVTVEQFNDVELAANFPVRIEILNVQNPISDLATASIQVNTYNPSDEALDTALTGLEIQATPGSFVNFSIQREGGASTVIGEDSVFIFNFQPTHTSLLTSDLRVTLPYWNEHLNPTNTDQLVHLTAVPTCVRTSGDVASSITCAYDTSTRWITFTDPFIAETNSAFSIEVSPMKNPPSEAVLTGFTAELLDSTTGIIDQTGTSSANIFATTESTITITEVISLTPKVGATSIYNLGFTSSMPMADGYYITLEFPTTLGLTELDTLWSSQGSADLSISDQTVTITNGFDQYYGNSTGDLSVTITIVSLVNPGSTAPIGDITVRTFTGDGDRVGSGTGGGTYTVGAADLLQDGSDAWVTPTLTNTNQETEYTFQFRIANTIPDGGAIQITFPPTVTIAARDETCTSLTTGIGVNAQCQVLGQELKITGGYTFSLSPGTVKFGVNRVTNPPTTDETTSFVIKTYTDDTFTYVIDTSEQTSITLVATISPLQADPVAATPPIVTGGSSTYTFDFRTGLSIPAGGYFMITFPSSISVVSVADAQDSCTITNFTATGMTCEVTSSSIKVVGAFPTEFLAGDVVFQVGSMKNPPSTAVSDSFTIVTYDATDGSIEENDSGITIQPTEANTLRSASITPAELVNGKTVTYTVMLVSENPFSSPIKVRVEKPAQITAWPVSPTCNPTGTIVSAVSCSLDGDTLVASLTLVGSDFASGSTLEFSIDSIVNPNSMEPTDSFKLYLDTNDDYFIDKLETGLSVTMTSAGEIPTLQVAAEDTQINAVTAYSIVYTPANTHPAGSEIEIVVPDEFTISSISCTALFSLDAGLQCGVSGQKITITQGFAGDVTPPSQIGVRISTFTNPSATDETTAWTIVSKTSTGLTIDSGQVTSTFTCTSPCQTCLVASTNCTSCDPSSSNPYYYDSDCHATCKSGWVDTGTGTCVECTDPCVECTTLQTTCTTCPSNLPYLYNDTCNELCLDGFWGDGSTCSACVNPCNTCLGDTDQQCSSCEARETSPNIGSTTYLYSQQCLVTCPSGYAANAVTLVCDQCNANCTECSSANVCTECPSDEKLQDGACVAVCTADTYVEDGDICVACVTPCATCSGTTTNCVTCDGTQKLHNGSCVDSCPADSTIETDGVCNDCSGACATCSGSLTTCVTCDTGYKIYQSNLCISDCPTGTYVEINGACEACDASCATCETAVDNCATCPSGQLVYNGSCVVTCPENESVPSGTDLVCLACSDNCATCSGGINNCKSCAAGTYLYNNSCIPACAFGVTITDGTNCVDCDSECTYCSGTISNCTACPSGKLLYNGRCVSECTTGTTIQQGDGCHDCDANCFTCQDSVTTCVTCAGGSYLYSGTCLTTCPQNYSGINGVCVEDAAPTDCATGCTYLMVQNTACDSACNVSACNYDNQMCVTGSLVCQSGQYQVATECEPCVSPCNTCSSEENCSSCLVISDAQWYLYNERCYETCPSGTMRNGIVCVDCDSNWAECTLATTTCTSCQTGTFLYNNQCYASCPSQVTITSGDFCIDCNANCSECQTTVTNCTACPNGKYLQDGTCVESCSSGYLLVSDACRACADECQECSGDIQTCVTCSSDKFLYSDRCLDSCPSGSTIPSGNECLPCNDDCVSCTNTTDTCTVCETGKSLYLGLCLTSCPAGLESRDSQCQAPITPDDCSTGCTDVELNDSVCQEECNNSACNYDSGMCLPSEDCQAGKYRSTTECLDCEGDCNTCSTQSSCTSCRAAYDADGNITGQLLYYDLACYPTCPSNTLQIGIICEACNANCLTCISTVDTCLTCATDKVLYNGECLTACPNDVSVLNGTVCDSCSINCATCSGTTNYCTTCSDTKYQYDNDCFSQCPDGTTLTSSSGRVCLACSTTCLTCATSIANCTTCEADKFYYNGTCLDACHEGITVTYGNECVDCDSACVTCETSANNCTSCRDSKLVFLGTCITTCPAGYEEINSVCVALCADGCSAALLANSDCDLACNTAGCNLDNNICNPDYASDCGVGRYRDSTTCIDCVEPCDDCETATTCITCAQDSNGEFLLLQNGSCLSSCGTGWFQNSLVCEQCEATCETCETTSSNCVTCPGTDLIYDGTCVSGCPIGTHAPVDGVCTPCDVNCTECNTTPDTCSACQIGAVLNGSTCQLICDAGKTTTASSNGECLDCSSVCKTCLSLVTTCTSCEDGFILYNDTCNTACPAGSVEESGTCVPCIGCEECTTTPTTCTVCATGYVLSLTNKCTLAPNCPDGTTLTPTTQTTCVACDINCATCLDATDTCLSCYTGYYLTGTTCTACDSNCESCETSGTNCLSCGVGYLLEQAVCVNCTYPCLTCTSTLATCTACQDGLMLTGNSCVSCDPSCSGCSGLTENDCTSCTSPRVFYLGQCLICHESCLTCNGPEDHQCLTCNPDRTIVNGECISCYPTCLTCNGPLEDDCLSCSSDRSLIGTICLLCDATCTTCKGQGADQCISCTLPRSLALGRCNLCHESCETCDGDSSTDCLSCNEERTYVDGECVLCHPTCDSCGGTENTDCISCASNRAYNNGQCEACFNTCLTCAGQNENDCLSCDAGRSVIGGECLICNASCNTCSGPEVNDCLTCYDGFVLMDGQCNRCHESCSSCLGTGETDCQTCQYEATLIGGACVICHHTCQKCVGPGEAECSECTTAEALVSGQCIEWDQSCYTCSGSAVNQCLSCSTGNYLVNGVCRQCIADCLQCANDPTECTSCNDGHYLQGYDCLQCDSTCLTCENYATECTSCANGTVLVASQCENCSNNCATCIENRYKCLTCHERQGLINDQCFQCHASCYKCDLGDRNICSECFTSHQFLDPTTNLCVECDSLCLTCSGTASTCASCETGYVLMNNSCAKCDDSCLTCAGSFNNCSSCRTGVTLSEGACLVQCNTNQATIDNECYDCSSECVTCEGHIEYCTSCTDPALVRDRGQCIAACPDGKYDNAGECLHCEPTCATCNDLLACITCPINWQLADDGFCVEICRSDQYLGPNGVCINCSSNCLTCAEDKDKCATCPEGDDLTTDFTCETPCATGTTRTPYSNGSCISCSDQCLTCEDQIDKCHSCKENLYLYNHQCIESCPPGNTIIDGFECLDCHTDCITCTITVNQCVTCRSGLIWWNQSCVQVCPFGFEEISGTCYQCQDPTNCPYDADAVSTPTDDEVDGNTATAFPTNDSSTDSVVERTSSTDETEEFEEGDVPFPCSGAAVVTNCVGVAFKLLTPNVGMLGIMNAVNGGYVVVSWATFMAHIPSGTDDENGRRLFELETSGEDSTPSYIFIFMIIGLFLHFLCNIIFFCVYQCQIRKDELYTEWRSNHKCITCLIPFLGFFLTFYFFRILTCGLCNFTTFQATFTDNRRYYLPMIRLSYFHLVFVLVLMGGCAFTGLLYFSIDNVVWMMALDAFFVSLLLAIFVFCDIRRMEHKVNCEEIMEAKLKVLPDDLYRTFGNPASPANELVLGSQSPKGSQDESSEADTPEAGGSTFLEDDQPLRASMFGINSGTSLHKDDDPYGLSHLSAAVEGAGVSDDRVPSIEDYPLGMTNTKDLDMSRAVRGVRPEFLTAPYKLVDERVTVSWPFKKCKLLEPKKVKNFVYDAMDFDLDKTVVDEVNPAIVNLCHTSGKWYKIERFNQQVKVLDVEPKDEGDDILNGLLITEENIRDFDFSEGRTVSEDIELCTARYKPLKATVLIRKTWHNAKIVGTRFKIGIDQFKDANVFERDVSMASITRIKTRERLEMQRSFIGGRVIERYREQPEASPSPGLSGRPSSTMPMSPHSRPMLTPANADRPSLASVPETPQAPRPQTMSSMSTRKEEASKVHPDQQLFTKAAHRKPDERPITSPFRTAGNSVVKHK